MAELLRCDGITKKYGPLIALNNIDLSIEGGRIIGLLGPNGSGKTTLIKLINGLLTPTSGSLTVCGALPESRRRKSWHTCPTATTSTRG